jgi:hypothetical protein
MVDRPTSAAQSIYPHLKAGTPEPAQRGTQSNLASTMYPAQPAQPAQPKPKPHPLLPRLKRAGES